MTDSTNIQSR